MSEITLNDSFLHWLEEIKDHPRANETITIKEAIGIIAELYQRKRLPNPFLCPKQCPEPVCLLCDRTEPCGLLGPNSQPGDTPICQFDKTYNELCDMLKLERAKLDKIRYKIGVTTDKAKCVEAIVEIVKVET